MQNKSQIIETTETTETTEALDEMSEMAKQIGQEFTLETAIQAWNAEATEADAALWAERLAQAWPVWLSQSGYQST